MKNDLNFKIEPPVLIPWLSENDKKHNVVLFDMQINSGESDITLIGLKIAFNHIPIRKEKLTEVVEFYVGCTGAEIELKVDDGQIKKYTEASTINVDYKNGYSYEQKRSINLIPSIKSKVGEREVELKLGNLSYNKNTQILSNTSFQSEERMLAPVHLHDTIKWHLTLPRGKKAVRDYLLGNLCLSASCSFDKTERSGKVKVRPTDLLLFNTDKTPLPKRKAFFLIFYMYKKNINVLNRNGMEVTFEELI